MSDGTKAVDSDKVWTVLITNTSYLPGLLTLDFSLKRVKSQYPLVALYTDTFPAEGIAALKLRGILHSRIDYILPTKSTHDYSNDPRFYDCWSKLTPFSLTQYARVVQLDADMLVLKNMDELMDLELDDPEFAAGAKTNGHAPNGTTTNGHAANGTTVNGHTTNGVTTNGATTNGATTNGSNGTTATNGIHPTKPRSTRVFAAGHACVCNPLRKPHYPPDWIPSNCAFTSQHSSPDAAQTVSPDPCTASPLGFMNGGLQVVNPSLLLWGEILGYMESNAASLDFADQSLLSGLYKGRWVALPYVYNALKTLRWKGVHDAIWRDEEVKNVHYILTPNPWDELDGDGRSTSKDETHAWWADVNKERWESERERGLKDGFSG